MSVRKLSAGAIIAALYVVLTYAFSFMAYGPIQFRLAEALTVLPFFGSVGVWSLTVGCLASNVLSPYGVLDMVVGTFATLAGAVGTRLLSKSKKDLWYLAPLPPVVANTIFIGGLLTFQSGVISLGSFAVFAAEVALGEIVCCYGLGIPLIFLIRKNKLLSEFVKI